VTDARGGALMRELTSFDEVRNLLGVPGARAATKDRDRLSDIHRRWLAASPFCLMATAGADGACDVSPKGDPPGFTLVLSDTRIAIPERPGNKRADGFRNILSNPHVGLVYLVPGRSDTLRINGRARLVSDAPWFDRLVVGGHLPLLAVVVDIEQLFFHCAKAFMRSHLWEPGSWQPDTLPSRAEIAHLESPETTMEELSGHYGPAYADRLYQD
jgi:PPOX class probable FMN-dependent enzyme